MEGFTQFVSVSNWVHAVCGVSPDRLERWAAYIKEHKFFADPEVVQALTEFCQVKNELLRYQPLSNMIMRVLSLARGTEPRMEGLPDTPPVADITFFRNDPKHMRPPGDYDRLDAKRKPDVLATRATKAIDWEGKDRVDWTSALLCVELKFDGTHSAALEAARKRKLLAVNSNTDVEEQPVDVNARGAEDTEDVGDAEEETVETASVGSKRSRNSSSSSSKSRKKAKGKQVAVAATSFGEEPSTSTGSTSSEATKVIEHEIQLGGYALEVLASTRGTRLHSLGVLFRDDDITLWYFDASGPVRTRGVDLVKKTSGQLSLIKDFDLVAAIFISLSYCDPAQWGALPVDVIRPNPNNPYPKSFPPERLNGCTIDMTGPEDKTEYVVTLGDHIFSQYSLVGRRTTVYEGTSPAEEGVFVVKISQQYVGRTSEVDLVKRAKKYGVTNLVNIRKSKDLWKLSDGIRKAFDLPTGDDDRVMRCIVMDNYARLSEQLARDPDSIQIMVPQMIDCVDFLRYKAKILHRDISDSNIMYEPRSGQDWFVLIDFDLAVRVDKKGKPLGPTSRHRTGTLPFMAVDVIEDMHLVATEADYKPIVHCVRHDFESLLWVCLYFGIKTLSPNTPNRKVEEEKRRKYLAKWETGDCDDIHATKLKVFRQAKSTNKIPLSNHFEHLRPWFGAFLSCFRSGYQEFDEQSELGGDHEQSEQRPPRFELIETWFGHVTREKMLEAFDNLKLQEAASASTSVSASASESKPKPESEPESESDASSIASDD